MDYIKHLIYLLTRSKINTGVLPDPRPQEEKDKDYQHEELAMGLSIPQSIYGSKITESPYPIENQGATNSCIPHSGTLASGILLKSISGFFVRLSKIFLYRLRSNFPDIGMYLQNMADLMISKGVPLLSSAPTPSTEELCNTFSLTAEMITEASTNKVDSYINVKYANQIDTLAEIASKGTPISILIYATRAEWSQVYPQIYNKFLTVDNAEVQHCITILPNSGFIENGLKYVTIQDSAFFGGFHLRNLSETFIKSRLYGALYFAKLEYQAGLGVRPKHHFDTTKPLTLGMNSIEVIALQKCLQFEGLFPQAQECTGYFGGLTRAGVKKFQDRYADFILKPSGAIKPTGDCYSFTLNQLNNLYS